MVPQHHVVQLDGYINLATLEFPHKFTKHTSTKPSEIAERLEDATIVIATTTRLTYETLMSCGPRLQLVASLGVGVDNIDVRAIRERGLVLVNVPAQNTDAVTEHAFFLYGAVKRKIVPLHNYVLEGEWPKEGISMKRFQKAPRTNKEETLGIIGYGALGKGVEKMAKALGMTIMVAERKGEKVIRAGRTDFHAVLKNCTVLIMTCPLDSNTHNMIDEAELRTMPQDAIIVNVGRGGIINEVALANALREERIAGAATDVYETEPATKATCPLLDATIPNLVLSPHIAWYAAATIKGTIEVSKKNLECFAAGKPQNVVVGGLIN